MDVMHDDDLPEDMRKALAQMRADSPNVALMNFDPDRGNEQFEWRTLGMQWVEDAVRRAFPGAEIFPMLLGSALYGGYFDEFDHWRSAFRFDVPRSFQGVVINDKGFASSWIPLVNNGLTGLYGRPYDARSVSVICLDNFLVRLACSSLYELIVNCAAPADSGLERLRQDDVHAILSYQSFLSAQPPNALEVEALHRSREAFLEASKALAAGPYQHDVVREMPILLPHANGADPFAMRFRRYCESMVIHFQIGHEFGHYCFHEGKDPRFDRLHELVRELVAASTEPVGEDTLEEVFCDVLGLENCLFQQQHFAVPLQFAVFASLWIIELIGRLVETEERASDYPETLWAQIRTRSTAMRAWWTRTADSNAVPALRTVLEHADSAVAAPARAVSSRLQRRRDELDEVEVHAAAQSSSIGAQDNIQPLDLDELMRSAIDKGMNGDLAGAIADFTSIVESPLISVQLMGIAYLNRGITKLSLADEIGAIDDFRHAIEQSSGDAAAKAYLARASVRHKLGDLEGACFDCTAAGLIDDIAPDVLAEALLRRAALREAGEDVQGVIADCTIVIQAPSMPRERIAEALLLRGTVKAKSGDFGLAIDDFTSVLAFKAADRPYGIAILYRAECRGLRGETTQAESDYETLIALPDVPDDIARAARRQLSLLRSVGR